MKRVLSTLLSVLLLASALSLSAMAAMVPPVGGNSDVPELTISDTAPTVDEDGAVQNLISQALTTSAYCSIKGATDINWVSAPDISAIHQLDIADHFKYGFSVAGVAKMQRAAWGAVDHIWTTGNSGGANTAGASSYGTFAMTLNEYLYNYKGEKVLNPEYTPKEGETVDVPTSVPEGYIYQFLMTFNFGAISNIDSFGYYGADKFLPQAADIYVSNDGVTWTMIGYYDRITAKMEGRGGEYAAKLNASQFGKDGKNVVDADTAMVTMYDLPDDTKAQFLRIACTAGTGLTDGYNAESVWGSGLMPWDAAQNGKYHHWREMFVFGEKTEEVGYVYDEENDPYVKEAERLQAEEDAKQDEDTEDGGSIITKPKDEVTTKEEQTTAPDSEVVTTDTNATEGGCFASVAGCAALLFTVSAGAALTMKRRKQ